MSSCEQIEIHFEDHHQKLRKWCYPLKEDAFASFMSRESSPQIDKIFGAGSLFSPLLFGKFFDPSDAFPLWEFDSDSLLQGSGQQQRQHKVDWFQTDADYVLKAELPEPSNNIILQVCLENGKILEINVRPRMKPHQHHHKSTVDNDNWKSSSNWWEHGHVRRIELPPNDQTDWRRTEAYVKNGMFLEIKIPKTSASASASACAPPP